MKGAGFLNNSDWLADLMQATSHCMQSVLSYFGMCVAQPSQSLNRFQLVGCAKQPQLRRGFSLQHVVEAQYLREPQVFMRKAASTADIRPR